MELETLTGRLSRTNSFENLTKLLRTHSISTSKSTELEKSLEYFRVLSGSTEMNENCSEDEAELPLVKPRPLKTIFSTAGGTGMCSDPFILNQMISKKVDPSEKLPPFLQEMGQTHPLDIILVSDNEKTTDTVEKQLELIGYNLRIHQTGKEALSHCQESQIEYIILILALY